MIENNLLKYPLLRQYSCIDDKHYVPLNVQIFKRSYIQIKKINKETHKNVAACRPRSNTAVNFNGISREQIVSKVVH